MKTLLLDGSAWDLVLDASGNIALAADPYSIAQDAASAIRTWQGEVYYDTSLGMPYLQSILGRFPSAQFIKVNCDREAARVPGVAVSRTYLTLGAERQLGGQVQIVTTDGETAAASAASLPVLPPRSSAYGQLDFTDLSQSAWFVGM